MKSERNKTIEIKEEEKQELYKNIITDINNIDINNKIILADTFETARTLPSKFVDLLFIDPPYNIYKEYNSSVHKKMDILSYNIYLEQILDSYLHTLKDNASIFICSDWNTSSSVHIVGSKYFEVMNRITFERDKGRGSKTNWKNNSEDIWHFVKDKKNYKFNIDSVMHKKKVIAPYKDDNNKAKDWKETKSGEKFRKTHPSNIWTDITIPFWSMSENTEHPTQKPEKLLAKIILAATDKDDFVLDPMAGSGTTGVVAKKLGRNFLMIELDEMYSLYASKRLEMSNENKNIQGYKDGVFLERNMK